MAKKKARTPPPPRRPGPRTQAPKTRSAPTDSERRTRLILYGVAVSGVVGLLIVIAAFAFGGGGTADAKAAGSTIKARGCQFKTYKELPRAPHYTTLTPKPPPKWNSVPPTSGRHYVTPLVFGPYEEPVTEIQAVHNLEHGAVIVQWGSGVPKSDVDKITSWYREDPNAVIIAPLPALGKKIALTAWTRWAECGSFDKKAFDTFRKAFRYQAPEKFPKDYLNPGQ